MFMDGQTDVRLIAVSSEPLSRGDEKESVATLLIAKILSTSHGETILLHKSSAIHY